MMNWNQAELIVPIGTWPSRPSYSAVASIIRTWQVEAVARGALEDLQPARLRGDHQQVDRLAPDGVAHVVEHAEPRDPARLPASSSPM